MPLYVNDTEHQVQHCPRTRMSGALRHITECSQQVDIHRWTVSQTQKEDYTLCPHCFPKETNNGTG